MASSSRIYERVASSEFAMVLTIAQLCALIPLKNLLPELDWTTAISYMLIPFFLSVYGGLTEKVRGVKFWQIWFYGVMGFIATAAGALYLFTQVLELQLGVLTPLTASSVIATQVLFVAPSEELAFRFAIPAWIRKKLPRSWKWTPAILSSMLFALFHYSAYSGSWTNIALAFVVGMIWSWAYTKWGLGATIGSHAAYNLVIAGLFSGGL